MEGRGWRGACSGFGGMCSLTCAGTGPQQLMLPPCLLRRARSTVRGPEPRRVPVATPQGSQGRGWFLDTSCLLGRQAATSSRPETRPWVLTAPTRAGEGGVGKGGVSVGGCACCSVSSRIFRKTTATAPPEHLLHRLLCSKPRTLSVWALVRLAGSIEAPSQSDPGTSAPRPSCDHRWLSVLGRNGQQELKSCPA